MRSVCYERVWPVEEFSANGEQCLNRLCQLRGQAHQRAKSLTISLPYSESATSDSFRVDVRILHVLVAEARHIPQNPSLKSVITLIRQLKRFYHGERWFRFGRLLSGIPIHTVA